MYISYVLLRGHFGFWDASIEKVLIMLCAHSVASTGQVLAKPASITAMATTVVPFDQAGAPLCAQGACSSFSDLRMQATLWCALFASNAPVDCYTVAHICVHFPTMISPRCVCVHYA